MGDIGHGKTMSDVENGPVFGEPFYRSLMSGLCMSYTTQTRARQKSEWADFSRWRVLWSLKANRRSAPRFHSCIVIVKSLKLCTYSGRLG
jgi:hypothetical protein